MMVSCRLHTIFSRAEATDDIESRIKNFWNQYEFLNMFYRDIYLQHGKVVEIQSLTPKQIADMQRLQEYVKNKKEWANLKKEQLLQLQEELELQRLKDGDQNGKKAAVGKSLKPRTHDFDPVVHEVLHRSELFDKNEEEITKIEEKVSSLYSSLKEKGLWNEKISKEFLVRFVKSKLRLKTMRKTDKDAFDAFFSKIKEIEQN